MSKLLTKGIGHTNFKNVKWNYRKKIEIPEDWECEKFGDRIKLEYGSGLIEKERDDKGFHVYGSGGRIGLHSKPIVKGEGIIIARKGSLGNVFYEKDDFFPIDTVFYITKEQTLIDLNFLYYYLKHMRLENFASITSKSGISRKFIYSLKIKFPSLPEEQQKIASILSNIDKQIQKKKLHKSILENLKKGLMQNLLTGKIIVKD